MKNKIAATLVVVLGLVAVGLYASAYIVEEGQQVIVTQFGKPVAAVDQAGLNFKSPFIQEIHYLEKRLLPWDGAPESMQTRDKKRIDIDVWARWQIVDPMTFYVKVRNEIRGQKILDDLVDSAVRDVVARHKLIDVVRKSNAELVYESEELERRAGDLVQGRGRDDVEEEILSGVDLDEYGMALTKVRIKRVNYVASVRRAVYDRMISERLRIARLYDSEAIEEQNKIFGQTQKELDQIEGAMEKEAAEIRGSADARVIELTAQAYGQSPEFFEFLRRLEVFEKSLREDTRLILSTKSELFRSLTEPDELQSRSTATQ
ncbi:MAG: protease modulator HflC [Pirellulales bacterium]|nr:protease modulator HflC [Pirellulales bacterium]